MPREYKKARELINKNERNFPADTLGLLSQLVDSEENFWATDSFNERKSMETIQTGLEDKISALDVRTYEFDELYLSIRELIFDTGDMSLGFLDD